MYNISNNIKATLEWNSDIISYCTTKTHHKTKITHTLGHHLASYVTVFCFGSTRPHDVLYLRTGLKMQYICVREMGQINVKYLLCN